MQNQHVKEGRDKKVRFECVFSKNNVKAKWFKGKQEVFMGKKFKMTSTGDLHVLEISDPAVIDAGKYICQCLDVKCEAQLDVDDPDPVYKFVKKLEKESKGYTEKETVLECTTNSPKAPVRWYRGDTKLETNNKYHIEEDQYGKKFLRIQDSVIADSDTYTCKINMEEFTTTKLTVVEQSFKFMRVLKSIRINENDALTLECELDEWDAPVTWYFNGEEIKSDKKRELIAEGRKRRLIIKKAKVSDEGKYLCKTKGDETDAEVLVERKLLNLCLCNCFAIQPHLLPLQPPTASRRSWSTRMCSRRKTC